LDKIVLEAHDRELVGSGGSKKLRLSGRIPGVVYGHGNKVQHVDVDAIEMEKVYSKAGRNKMVALKVDEGRAKNVVIYAVQCEPVKGKIRHFDLYVVKMDEELRADVPIRFIGESTAVYKDEGTLFKNLESLEVECLPANLPDGFTVDISVLDDFDQVITVADIVVPEDVKLTIEDLDTIVARVDAPRGEDELSELDEKVVEELPEGVQEEEPIVVTDNYEEDKDRLTMK
jgi:large subunit ribosomal protein L25